jgi:ABC-type Mn2+/Zn2+ transport system ATPase subunit
MDSSSLLSLRGASFGYAGRAVISGVDLEIEPAAFLGIVGPNGAGKTTLMRGMLGLLEPLEGEVVRRTTATGYVPQRETLDPVYPLSVQEVVSMGAYGRLRGWRRLGREERELVSRSLERVGLGDQPRRRFSRLSGGQRQRALIARALVMQPRLLLLDEPTSGVDLTSQKAIVALLQELNREEALAILLVSHQLDVTRSSVREVVWVADGKVRAEDKAELLRPERFDAAFTGRGPEESGEI